MIAARRMVVGVVVGAFALGACAKKQPEPPAPQPATTQNDDAAAERAAREREEAARRAREEAAARARAEAEHAKQVLTEMIHFAYDESTIDPEAQQILVQKASILRAHPELRMRISGHADERGSVEYNIALGMRRAEAAKAFLVNYGLDASRFETVTFGEERPIAQGHDESAWSQNRRDEFQITAGESSLMPSSN